MTDIRLSSPVSYVLPRIERASSHPLGKNPITSFSTLLRVEKEARPSQRNVASTQRQPESAMAMARRPNVEAMLQQLIAYGKKHLYVEGKPEKSALSSSSYISDCSFKGDLVGECCEATNAVCPNEDSTDLCTTHIQDATAWLATFCGNSHINSMPIESPSVALPGLFVWVWVPPEKVRAQMLWARPCRRPRLSVAASRRYESVVGDASDE